MSTIEDYVARIEGICGADKNVVIVLKDENKDIATDSILKRCDAKKSVSSYMFELKFQNVTFHFFISGRLVLRGVKNRRELNRILAALLL
jgi:hypothetical protein